VNWLREVIRYRDSATKGKHRRKGHRLVKLEQFLPLVGGKRFVFGPWENVEGIGKEKTPARSLYSCWSA